MTIAPGSSGGPLIDATGGVLALARDGMQGANIPLFAPIGDAMGTLKIVIRWRGSQSRNVLCALARCSAT